MAERAAVHRSRIDPLLFSTLGGLAAGLLVLGAASFRREHALDGIFGALFTAAGLFLLWAILSVRYVIRGAVLILQAGPVRRIIPVHRIVEVFPSGDPAPALAVSLDRLRINYHSERQWRYSLVSPRDKDMFLRDLASADPGLELRGRTLVRTPV